MLQIVWKMWKICLLKEKKWNKKKIIKMLENLKCNRWVLFMVYDIFETFWNEQNVNYGADSG